MAPFTFCRVCRINHDKGKGHKYGVKHKQYLAEFLSKARAKIQDVRSSLTEVALLQEEGRGRSKFWCNFCELEVDEKESTFARESAIQHLGSSSHVTSVKNFLSEQGAVVADSHRYFISKDELSKWQERCKNLKATMARTSGVELSRTNNIHSDTSHTDPGSSLALGNRQTVLHVASVDDVQPLSVLTVGSSQRPVPMPMPMHDGASYMANANGDRRWFSSSAATTETSQPGNVEASTSNSSHDHYPETLNGMLDMSRGVHTTFYSQGPGAHWSATNSQSNASFFTPASPAAATTPQYTVMATSQELAKIVCPALLPGEGNVHSGATPPWIGPSDDKKLRATPASSETGPPNMETVQPLSKTQERKLAKLRPPNRVGAAWADMRRAQLERAARGEPLEAADASWLPNFGRVWQSGSRHDTKKEFEAEKRREAKRLGRPLGRRGADSSQNALQSQLYVQKPPESPRQVQPYVRKRQRTVNTDE